MSKNLNTSEACTINMVETDTSKDVTVLEKTARRLAEELHIPLKDTSGISYICALEGKKEGIEFDYHNDFDGYEAFAAAKGNARFAVNKAYFKESGVGSKKEKDAVSEETIKRTDTYLMCKMLAKDF